MRLNTTNNLSWKAGILILLFSIPNTSLHAQDRLIKPEMYVGANVGLTGSEIYFYPTVKQNILFGSNGGFIFRYIAEKNVGIQAELNFSQRGWSEKDTTYARKLNYVEIPLMTHIYIGKKNRFFVNLGPKISYLISEKTLKNETTAGHTLRQHTQSVENPFDYGLCGGFGVLFTIHRNIFQMDVRGAYSLSNIFSNSKKDFYDYSNNVNFSVNLGWLVQVK